MSHFVAYILQFQEIIVYKIPPGGGGGSIASLKSKTKSCSKGRRSPVSTVSFLNIRTPQKIPNHYKI